MVGRMLTGEIFGPNLLVVGFIFFILFGCSIWAIIDASSHSKRDFYEAGSSKVAWIVVIAVFTLFFSFGCLIAIYYLIRVRPRVRRIDNSHIESPV